MNYKEYFDNVKKELEVYSDYIYCEPMTEADIVKIEKQLDISIKPLFREYLSSFGIVQDVFENIMNDVELFLNAYDDIAESYNNYIPIFVDLGLEDTISLLNNNDISDDYIYEVKVDSNENVGKLKKTKPFQQMIEESISLLKKNYKDRCHNNDKVNVVEFTIYDDGLTNFKKAFKEKGLKKKTKWKPKYDANNIFGDEVAIFELFKTDIIIERDQDKSQFLFELQESVFTKSKKSIIMKIDKVLKEHNVDYKKSRLIGERG